MTRRRASVYIRRKLGVYGNKSYAQSGEDIILRHLFDIIGVAVPRYLDIGANHPVHLSNSYLFTVKAVVGYALSRIRRWPPPVSTKPC